MKEAILTDLRRVRRTYTDPYVAAFIKGHFYASNARAVRPRDREEHHWRAFGWAISEHLRRVNPALGWSSGRPAGLRCVDRISGALFGALRPGLARLLAALTPRPVFSVPVMSEESRLGREAIETAWALKRITDAGVRVFFHLDDRERTLDSPTDKVMLSLTAFAAEMERDRAPRSDPRTR